MIGHAVMLAVLLTAKQTARKRGARDVCVCVVQYKLPLQQHSRNMLTSSQLAGCKCVCVENPRFRPTMM